MNVNKQTALIGLAVLMRMALQGKNFSELTAQLIERATNDENDANALMDLSTILQLTQSPEAAMNTQAAALAIQPLYHIPASINPRKSKAACD